jgi:hypothetical protein
MAYTKQKSGGKGDGQQGPTQVSIQKTKSPTQHTGSVSKQGDTKKGVPYRPQKSGGKGG